MALKGAAWIIMITAKSMVSSLMVFFMFVFSFLSNGYKGVGVAEKSWMYAP
jgi:hypothetical protein